MKIELIEKNYDIGKRLQTLIEKKLQKLDRYFNEDATARVVCSLTGKTYKMEVTIASKGLLFRSEVIGENMYENIDTALPKIEKQIIKQSGKRKDSFKKSAFDKHAYEFITEEPKIVKSEVVKKKSFELVPETLDDAIVNLENIDHDFYVFLNAETGKVNVVYTRKDGKLGLIECKY